MPASVRARTQRQDREVCMLMNCLMTSDTGSQVHRFTGSQLQEMRANAKQGQGLMVSMLVSVSASVLCQY